MAADEPKKIAEDLVDLDGFFVGERWQITGGKRSEKRVRGKFEVFFCWGGLDRNDELNKEFRDKLDKQIHWFGEII